MKRYLTIGLAVIFAVSVLGFIFSGRKENFQVEEVKIFPVAEQKQVENKEIPKNYELRATSSPFSSFFEKTALEQNRKTFKEIGIKFEEFKQDLKQVIKSLPSFSETDSETAEEPLSSPSQISPIAPQKAASILSEKEIFAKLYPDYFTDGLAEIQKVFLERGFLDASYQKIENFDSEEKIFSFVNTNIGVFEKQGWYSKEEAEKFRKGANGIWKDLMEKERLELQQQLIKSEFYKKILASKIHYLTESISREFLEIFPKKVYADYVNSVDCYKSSIILPGAGTNLWAPCCDCGINCGRRSCWNIAHCGPEGCLVNLGCLNLFARFFPAAIWDEFSGICGIG